MPDLRRLAQPLLDDPPVAPTGVAELRARARRRRARRIASVAAVIAVVVLASTLLAFGRGSTKHSVYVGGRPATTVRSTATTSPVTPSPPVTVAPPLTLVPNAVPVGEMGLVSPGVGWAMNGIALYRTVDDGAHWTDITTPGTYDPLGHVDSLFFLDADHAWVAVSLNDHPFTLYRTQDGGASWQVACAGDGCAPGQEVTFLDAEHGEVIGAATGTGAGTLYVTSDGGRTWTRTGATPFMGPIHFVDRRDGWGVSDASGFDQQSGEATKPGGELFHTSNGGASWKPVRLRAARAGRPVRYGAPQFHGRDGVVPAFFAAPGGTSASPMTSIVMYSTHDGGATWAAHRAVTAPVAIPKVPDPSTLPFAASSSSATDWALLVGPRLFVTRDAGAQWSTISPNPPIHGAFGLAFASASDGWALGTARNCAGPVIRCTTPILWHTTDGGRTWRPLFPKGARAAG